MAKISLLLLLSLGILYQNSTQSPSSVRKDPSEIPNPPFANGCRVIFSELDVFTNDEKQFIELTKRCATHQFQTTNVIEMNKYKILFISHDAYLIGVCSLTGQRQGETWFYVIGMSGVENLNFDSANCQFSGVQIPNTKPRFPRGINFPVGLALIRNDKLKVLESLTLLHDNNNFRKTKITKQMENKIMKLLNDFYIVGSYTTYVHCKYFENFYSHYLPEPTTLLRDWSGSNQGVERSINRCDHSDQETYSLPFQPKMMKHSTKSPGRQNECENAFIYQVQPQIKRPRIDQDGCSTFFANRATQVEFMRSSNTYQNFLDRAASSTSTGRCNQPNDQYEENDNSDSNDEDIAAEDIEMDEVEPHVQNEFTANPIDTAAFEQQLEGGKPYIWNSCSRFSKHQLNQMQELQHSPIDVGEILKTPTCQWIEYIAPVKKIRCHWCHKLLNQNILVDRPRSSLITDIMTTGAGKSDVFDGRSASKARSYNKKLIKEHEQNPLHKVAQHYFTLYDENKRGEELKTDFEQRGSLFRKYMEAAEYVIVAVIQSTKMGISFRSYNKVVELLDYFQVPIGQLYKNEKGMQMVQGVIGEYLHSKFVKQIKDTNLPVSITLDSTTDRAGYSVLAIVFQTFTPTGDVKVFLYRIIPIPGRETGVNLFNTFLQSIKEDSLETYIKSKTVGLTTDGHPSLLSIFRRKLNSFVSNEIIYNHCQCHRLELLNRKAYDSFDYLLFIDDFVNRLFKFFSSKTARRKQALRNEALQYGTRVFEPKRIQKIRWINSKLRAISPIISRHTPLVKALEEIGGDETFPIATRNKADDLTDTLKDGSVIASIAFLADINKELSELSLQLQTRSSTIVGTKSVRTELQNHLLKMKTEHGPYVKLLLEDSEIVDNEGNPDNLDVSLKDFETKRIKYRDVLLDQPNPISNGNALYERMGDYIDSLLEQFDNYFPEGAIADKFDIFWAQRFPERVEDIHDYGITEIKFLNGNLKWNYDNNALVRDWLNLVKTLIEDDHFDEFKEKRVEEFWGYYLKAERIAWTPILTEIIQKILTVPATSAEPERIFSIYSYTKTLQRFSLLPKTVENIIKIRFNGEPDLKNWDTLELAKALVSKHARPDDGSRRITWRKKTDTTTDADDTDSEISESDDDSDIEY